MMVWMLISENGVYRNVRCKDLWRCRHHGLRDGDGMKVTVPHLLLPLIGTMEGTSHEEKYKEKPQVCLGCSRSSTSTLSGIDSYGQYGRGRSISDTAWTEKMNETNNKRLGILTILSIVNHFCRFPHGSRKHFLQLEIHSTVTVRSSCYS